METRPSRRRFYLLDADRIDLERVAFQGACNRRAGALVIRIAPYGSSRLCVPGSVEGVSLPVGCLDGERCRRGGCRAGFYVALGLGFTRLAAIRVHQFPAPGVGIAQGGENTESPRQLGNVSHAGNLCNPPANRLRMQTQPL